MAAKLDIKTIELRNFLSYGDYVTKLDVSDLGPTLVLGDTGEAGSNGAGKSSLLTAFIWCLFGRTINNPSPGDRIVNWFVGQNCYVKIITTDGWVITRTRLTDNHNELLVYKNGDDTTKSTNKKAQSFIIEKFGLDYEIFTSSVFCGQFGKSFLEMTPVKRKEAIERLLGLDKINEYAGRAKQKCQEVEVEQKGVRTALDILKANLTRQEERIEGIYGEIKDWNDSNQLEINKLEGEIEQLIAELEVADPPNMDKLQKKWDLYNSILQKISEYRDKIVRGKKQIERLQGEIKELEKRIEDPQFFKVPNLAVLKEAHQRADEQEESERDRTRKHAKFLAEARVLEKEILKLDSKIAEWDEKEGSSCSLCEQEISQNHIHTQVADLNKQIHHLEIKLEETRETIKAWADPIEINRPTMSLKQAERLNEANQRLKSEIIGAEAKIKRYQEEISEIQEADQKARKIITKAETALSAAKPKETLEEARKGLSYYEGLVTRYNRTQQDLQKTKDAINPYFKVLKDMQSQLDESRIEASEHESNISQLDLLYNHYRYIYRSYSDRRKIKSLILSELIPYLKDRIAHYLTSFDIEMSIKFSSTLSSETDRWDYEFCSGGERKRIDLSIMFALYDLYMSLYGQQCNFMVLDEVDSRLDHKGVQAFADIVTSYFGEQNPLRPSSIFVISHKSELKDLFPSQIVIKKQDGFSVIEQN